MAIIEIIFIIWFGVELLAPLLGANHDQHNDRTGNE